MNQPERDVVVELTHRGRARRVQEIEMARKKKEKKAGKKSKKAEKKAAKEAAKKARKAAKTAKKSVKTAKKSVKKKSAKKAKKAVKKRKPSSGKSGKAARVAVARKAAPPKLKARQQPESLRLRSAGPSFTVSDLEASLAFYRDALGFTVGQRWEDNGQVLGVELLAGSVVFWLGQDDWKKGRDRVKGLGFRMYCATSQDIDALAARVRGAGGTVVDGPKDEEWGGRAFAVRDPDGFVITFASHT